MDLPGLVNNILEAAASIDAGRKGFAIRGKAEEGRILFEDGVSEALKIFKEAQTTANPQIIILAEYTFISQELEFCIKTNKYILNSLKKAVQRFDDAFLALQAVDEPGYATAEKTYPHDKGYRVKSYPKDSFHIACGSHKTRIQNILSSPGIDPIENDLLEQRLANLTTAQNSYLEKQKIAMEQNN